MQCAGHGRHVASVTEQSLHGADVEVGSFDPRQARANSAPLEPSGTLPLRLAGVFPVHSGNLDRIAARVGVSVPVRRQQRGVIEQARRQQVARIAPGGEQFADASG